MNISRFPSLQVLSKSYVFDPRPRFPLRLSAKRYWIGNYPDKIEPYASHNTLEDAFTLVFLHGNGAHKEHWEPTIERLFRHQQAVPRCNVRFHDMWSIDIPNLGDSAILNEEVLQWGYNPFGWENYTRAVHAFLAGLGSGVDVDFSKRSLVLVGHSMGANAAVSATTYYPLLKISSIHLFEPFLVGDKADPENWGLKLEKYADKREDVWSSKEEAFQALGKIKAVRTWDPRILTILVEHGLRPLPTLEYPDLNEGLTLKGTKRQETAIVKDRVSHGVAYRCLPHVLKEVPTHITYGGMSNFIPREWQEDVLHNVSGGISNFAGVSWIPDAGHMILQSHPDDIADIIWNSLRQSREHTTRKSNTIPAAKL